MMKVARKALKAPLPGSSKHTSAACRVMFDLTIPPALLLFCCSRYYCCYCSSLCGHAEGGSDDGSDHSDAGDCGGSRFS